MGRLLLRYLTHPTLRHPLPGALRPRPYPPHATPLSLPVPTPTTPATPPGPQPPSRPFQISPYCTQCTQGSSARDTGCTNSDAPTPTCPNNAPKPADASQN
ncbi:hypothetical protein TcasGA2_TC014232 [Tribolium castaneum]|uniref:Uncharacterized protein n=1 Tax=Tribolium castaneum TaxID=7070 RepID=D6W767_TRICA|nr:hypothetical protein TcasGA2_TC014232 [Tribolium castaneum]